MSVAKVTVQTIADRLSLSKFAVSRALSGKSGVSDQTRRLVAATAKEMGYPRRPLGQNSHGCLRVVLRSREEAMREPWIDIRNGLEMEAIRHGLSLDFVFADEPDAIGNPRADSMAYMLVGPHSRELIEHALSSGIYTIVVGHAAPALLKVDQVTTTNEEAGFAIGEFLLAKGHRDIVYVFGQRGLPGREERLHGLQQALVGRGARVAEVVFRDDYFAADLLPAIRDLVSSGFSPTAFFGAGDNVAVTVQSELQRLGLRIPLDCSVIGHADYPVAMHVTPHLTTVRVQNREVGIEAIKLFVARRSPDAGYQPPIPVRLSLVDEFIERGSTALAAAPDWHAIVANWER